MRDLDEVAEQLYGAPLGDFVARRKEAAAAAREEGDRAGATAIGALPKPSTAAWVVNLLARESVDVVDSLVALGESLREAQEDLDPDALRSLGDQRRRLVAQVAKQAVALADDHGQKVGPSIRDEIEQTLQAALADAAASDAVRTGRLVRSLEPNGFDAVDLDGAVAGGDTPRNRPSSSGKKSVRPSQTDEVAEARRRKEELEGRRREFDEAKAELEAARERAQRATSSREEAQRTRDDLHSERDDLRARLDEVEDELTRASAALRSAASESDDAADALSSAEDAESRARARYSALRKKGE